MKMKQILLMITCLFFFLQVTAQTRTYYTCPMHPEVQQQSPGKCPKCGMSLIKRTVKAPVRRPAPAQKPPVTKPRQQTPAKPPVSTPPAASHDHTDQTPEKPVTTADTATVASGPRVIMRPGKTVVYHLYITDTVVNFTGKQKHAYAINGTIPGPDLHFTEGDTAEIYLHNKLKKEETSLHWHGVMLPNRFDGVPYLTTAPVHPGDVHLYKFAIRQNGTYWYHSHSGLQEQAGIYGALIFHKREGQEMPLVADREAVEGNDGKVDGTAQEGMMQDSMTAMDHTAHGAMNDTTKMAMDNSAHQIAEGADQSHPNMPHGEDHMQMITPAPLGDGSYTHEHTVVLSEWTDEDPDQVQRRLRTVNDWYAIKKGSTQSYSEAIAAGHFKTKVTNEWKRMNAMDVSDVFYNKFLINGKPQIEAARYKKGDRVRLRIVNAGASSYFWLTWGGGKITVIGNDGNEVVPIEVDRLIVGVSETYDVVVSIPENRSYEFRATPEDRTQAASLWLGNGMKMPAPKLPRLRYFEGMQMMNDMMKMNGDMKAMDMQMSLQQMDMNVVMYDEINNPQDAHAGHAMVDKTVADSTEASNMIDMQGVEADAPGITTLNYAMLRSPVKTVLKDMPFKELHFELTGNMNRYVWSINDKIVREWDKILIEKGQNVRIIMYNNSMMRHPMHLHGHDFRVINGQGEYAPFKNVLDIMPMETDTIEFAGTQDGDWFFHCHILYHMMAGMGNVFSYKSSSFNPELPDKVEAYNKFLRNEKMAFHPMAEIGLESNGSDGRFMLSGERYELRTEWRIGLKQMHGNEAEAYFGRYLGKMQWLYPFVGFDYHRNTRENESEKNLFGQLSNQNNRKAFVAGVEYVLPMLFRAQFRMDSKGKFRFQLGREDIPLTPRLRLNAMWNTDKEYMAGFRYIVRKWLALSTHYDSDMGFGAGVAIIY